MAVAAKVAVAVVVVVVVAVVVALATLVTREEGRRGGGAAEFDTASLMGTTLEEIREASPRVIAPLFSSLPPSP